MSLKWLKGREWQQRSDSTKYKFWSVSIVKRWEDHLAFNPAAYVLKKKGDVIRFCSVLDISPQKQLRDLCCTFPPEKKEKPVTWGEKINSHCAAVTARGGKSKAWISQRLCITLPLTVEHTHLVFVTQARSIPVPAAGHTSAQDYQISSLRFGSPNRACVWCAQSELGHLDGAIVPSLQGCFVAVTNENSPPTVRCRHATATDAASFCSFTHFFSPPRSSELWQTSPNYTRNLSLSHTHALNPVSLW